MKVGLKLGRNLSTIIYFRRDILSDTEVQIPIIGGININGTGLTTVSIGVTDAENMRTITLFNQEGAPGEYLFDQPIRTMKITILFHSELQTGVSIDLYGFVKSKCYYSSQHSSSFVAK